MTRGRAMDSPQRAQTVREAIGVVHDPEAFLTAVDELLSAGFDRADLNLLAGERAIQQKLGHAYQQVQELEDDATVPRVAFVGPRSLALGRIGITAGLAYIGAVAAAGAVVASGGTLAATIAAAAIAGGSGGLLGSVGARLLGRERAEAVTEQLDRGGLLLWVHCRDGAHEQRAIEILTRHGADDVHVHDLPAVEEAEANPLADLELDPFLPGARL